MKLHPTNITITRPGLHGVQDVAIRLTNVARKCYKFSAKCKTLVKIENANRDNNLGQSGQVKGKEGKTDWMCRRDQIKFWLCDSTWPGYRLANSRDERILGHNKNKLCFGIFISCRKKKQGKGNKKLTS